MQSTDNAKAIPRLRQLADWLSSFAVTHIAMEATGVYWEPVWNVLDQRSTSRGRAL
jgi:transposase